MHIWSNTPCTPGKNNTNYKHAQWLTEVYMSTGVICISLIYVCITDASLFYLWPTFSLNIQVHSSTGITMGSSPRCKLQYFRSNSPVNTCSTLSETWWIVQHITFERLHTREREQKKATFWKWTTQSFTNYVSLRSVAFCVPVIDRQDGFPETNQERDVLISQKFAGSSPKWCHTVAGTVNLNTFKEHVGFVWGRGTNTRVFL